MVLAVFLFHFFFYFRGGTYERVSVNELDIEQDVKQIFNQPLLTGAADFIAYFHR